MAGRPRSAFPLRYQLRLTAEQMRAWQDAAARDGRELQNWIRWTLDRAANTKTMKKPSPKDFDCPDCPAKAGQNCRSARGNSLPTFHARRVYLAQDAFPKQAGGK